MSDLETTVKVLRKENDALKVQHLLDTAEIIRLRRWVEALEREKEELIYA